MDLCFRKRQNNAISISIQDIKQKIVIDPEGRSIEQKTETKIGNIDQIKDRRDREELHFRIENLMS